MSAPVICLNIPPRPGAGRCRHRRWSSTTRLPSTVLDEFQQVPVRGGDGCTLIMLPTTAHMPMMSKSFSGL